MDAATYGTLFPLRPSAIVAEMPSAGRVCNDLVTTKPNMEKGFTSRFSEESFVSNRGLTEHQSCKHGSSGRLGENCCSQCRRRHIEELSSEGGYGSGSSNSQSLSQIRTVEVQKRLTLRTRTNWVPNTLTAIEHGEQKLSSQRTREARRATSRAHCSKANVLFSAGWCIQDMSSKAAERLLVAFRAPSASARRKVWGFRLLVVALWSVVFAGRCFVFHADRHNLGYFLSALLMAQRSSEKKAT